MRGLRAIIDGMFRLPKPNIPIPKEKIKTGIALSAGALVKSQRSPDEAFGDLFDEVQRRNILGDGKTFVDLVPRKRARAIKQEYELSRQDPNFDLAEFINRHFYEFAPHKEGEQYIVKNDTAIDEHIAELWPHLTRRNRVNRGSLLALPYPYIVPGGRFGEQFYWDSYFIMLGLAADGQWEMISNMMKNYQFMIRKYGYIPTANRNYFLSRSQPPFFAHMVQLLASHYGKRRVMLTYLPYLLSEYRFWMKGRERSMGTKYQSWRRVVHMPDGSLMNRYYDNLSTPRPESHREDIEAAEIAKKRQPDRVYLHLRAAAESGWDFSSRWFHDSSDISTIHTADIIPVDLNCLLYTLETTIADSYRLMKNSHLAKKFDHLAEARKQAINDYCWDDKLGIYRDYNFHLKQQTNSEHLAMVFPLYAGVASQEQADRVAQHLRDKFLHAGGLVTTLVDNGQQWDSPNGWAPLQWVAIQGLRSYGHDDLADEVKQRWMKLTKNIYRKHRRLVEKYDVVGGGGLGGGGEYPLQDGFGWTNGVYKALLSED